MSSNKRDKTCTHSAISHARWPGTSNRHFRLKSHAGSLGHVKKIYNGKNRSPL